MSSDEDSDDFENFLAEQKNKVKKRYIYDSELEELKKVDNFIIDDELSGSYTDEGSEIDTDEGSEYNSDEAVEDNSDEKSENHSDEADEDKSDEDYEESTKKESNIIKQEKVKNLRKKSETPLFSDCSEIENDMLCNSQEIDSSNCSEFNGDKSNEDKDEQTDIVDFEKSKSLDAINKNILTNHIKENVGKKSGTPLFSDSSESDIEELKIKNDDSKYKMNVNIFKTPIITSRKTEEICNDNSYRKDFIGTTKSFDLNFAKSTPMSSDGKPKKFDLTPLLKDKPITTPISQLLKKPAKFSRLQINSDTDESNDSDESYGSYSDSESDVFSDNENSEESDLSNDGDSDDYVEKPTENFQTPISLKKTIHIKQTPTLQTKQQSNKLDFISSLMDDCADKDRDPEAIKYRKNFKRLKGELALKIYQIYNEKAFLNKLPKDIDMKWFPRLRKTAGRCAMSRNRQDKSIHNIQIQLSAKVLTDAERLLKTLVHEMCHGAVWMINKVDGHHGPIWKTWVQQAHRQFTKVPVCNRCHNYKILTKYEYWCLSCNVFIGRHSKSIDTAKKVCGRCRGKFTLFVNQPNGEKKNINEEETKTLTGFPKFVKENYQQYRGQCTSHGAAMKILSEKYKAQKEENVLTDMLNTMNIQSK